ncbi:MAG: hypothetical protein KAI79_04590 [Bacteroidales bacterium]|nr:hypothetical protein [Bacteroidales bacterium]
MISKLAPQLEKENQSIVKKLEDLNNAIDIINNWLFIAGIVLGGLTVGLFNLLRSM